ncbi:C2 domain-containing protein [Hirschfeldia incana]|nr:C2 domain-containing protein [Hirschfeldia incana]
MANEKQSGLVYLHGDLELQIIEARYLPNMDLHFERIRRVFNTLNLFDKHFSSPKSSHRRPRNNIITSDPYVTVCLAGATVARTRVISNSQNPVWGEHFKIPLAHPVSQIEFYVKDNDVFGADLIGIATVSAAKIKLGETINGWFPIIGSPKPDSAVRLEMRFVSCEKNPLYTHGITSTGVANCYFPVRNGGHVTLYQDAHVHENMPEIELEDGVLYQHERCWEDICHSILEAHHIVYVIGWSIFHKVKLVREHSPRLPNGGDLSLGDLLKYKSQEGVRTGVMQTHDEETRKFFRRSSVSCVLSPRYASSKLSIFKQQVVGTVFSHHQKCVIVDTQASGNNRKIAAFIGGLDLCDGRYDTPEHRLFKGLDTVFKGDYHNPTFSVGPSTAVSTNDTLKVSKDDNKQNWHVQVFRSIDSGSLKGFPKDVHKAHEQNLVCAKNLVVEKSIQTAYIQAIRSAQHFIYIENQYFIGSSFVWPNYKEAGADNLIPIELALKIASKIRARERFAVYIVIPMWPEGDPSSAPVQEILYWQGQTMQMMYEIIAREIKHMDLENVNPQDYLNFYCLGNREELPSDINCVSSSDEMVSASQKCRRFMIYVHAKGMVVDDEYVLLGSANINQRSMAGSRDTEIAMGAYQNHQTWSHRNKHPRGQVYGYRMSLWAEHMGKIDHIFKEPESLECVKRVNMISEDNWKKYTENSFDPLRGHILKYPLSVDNTGKVIPLSGFDTFPDVGGKILGTRTNLPDVLTT